jgi:amino acid transporter
VTIDSGKKLVKNLNVWEAIGISVALMAPSMAANINPQGTAGAVGRAVPIAFALATVGVLLIAYGFVRLSQNFNHAGSVYGFVGATMGPRSGVVAGWGLIGTYVFYGCVTSMAAGIFGSTFLDELGVWKHQPSWSGFLVAAVAIALAYLFAIAPARNGTRLLLTVEAVTVVLILITTAIIFAKLAGGHAPGGHTVDWSVFTIPKGVSASAMSLGAVFGFLSFAGFEAAATLGEEAKNPRKDIPRAILGTAIFGGVYFVVVTAVEVMGFGTDASGVKAFVGSGSLLGDLGTQYVGSWIGTIITLGAAISAFGCCLACIVGASRLTFALGRDSGHAGLARVSEKQGTPVTATRVVVGSILAIVVIWKLLWKVKPFDIFLGSGVIGTLILLIAYVLATLGAIKFLFLSGQKRVAKWEIVIPVSGILLLVYTLYKNVIPFPTAGAARAYPIVGGIWLLIGFIGILARPALAKRLGEKLTADENLSAAR